MSVFLKIKLKSLAAESRIIRAQENKTRKPYDHIRESLYRHRIDVVRVEARHTHLAYGFLRGREISVLEHENSRPFDKDKVKGMIKKYGTPEQLKAWDTI